MITKLLNKSSLLTFRTTKIEYIISTNFTSSSNLSFPQSDDLTTQLNNTRHNVNLLSGASNNQSNSQNPNNNNQQNQTPQLDTPQNPENIPAPQPLPSEIIPPESQLESESQPSSSIAAQERLILSQFVIDVVSATNSLPLPVVSVNKLVVSDIYTIPKDSHTYYQSYFTSYCERTSNILAPGVDFNYLKSKESSTLLLSFGNYIFLYWHVIYWFYNIFMFAHKVFILDVRPISSYYLKYLDLVIRDSDTISAQRTTSAGVFVNSLLFSQICPRVSLFIGTAIYGASLSAFSLLLFVVPDFKSLSFSACIKTDNKPSTISLKLSDPNKHINPTPDTKPVDLEYSYTNENRETIDFVATFDIDRLSKEVQNLSTFHFDPEKSPFYKDAYSVIFNKFFKITSDSLVGNTIDIKLAYAYTESSNRTSSTSRDEDGKFKSYLGGFMIKDVLTSNVTLSTADHYVCQFIQAMFYFKSLNLSNDSVVDILRYIVSLIAAYALSQVINGRNITLLGVDINFNVRYNAGKTLTQLAMKEYFNSIVDSGLFLPITPLHFAFYYTKNANLFISRWLKIIVYSSLLFPGFSDSLKTVIPITDLDSKRNFHEVCNNREMLKSSYFGSRATVVHSFKHVELQFHEFMTELSVRTYLFDNIPDYLPLYSKGKWKGITASSKIIKVAQMNSYFVKFSSLDHSAMKEYIHALSLDNAPGKPAYVKGSARCVDQLPDVMLRQLDDAGESEPDID